MNVAIDPERRLLDRGSRASAGHGQHPDVATLMAFSDGLDGHELGIFGGEGLEDFRQLGVAVETIEGDGGHGGGRRSRGDAWRWEFGPRPKVAILPAFGRASRAASIPPRSSFPTPDGPVTTAWIYGILE
jgi:hypothetical protein